MTEKEIISKLDELFKFKRNHNLTWNTYYNEAWNKSRYRDKEEIEHHSKKIEELSYLFCAGDKSVKIGDYVFSTGRHFCKYEEKSSAGYYVYLGAAEKDGLFLYLYDVHSYTNKNEETYHFRIAEKESSLIKALTDFSKSFPDKLTQNDFDDYKFNKNVVILPSVNWEKWISPLVKEGVFKPNKIFSKVFFDYYIIYQNNTKKINFRDYNISKIILSKSNSCDPFELFNPPTGELEIEAPIEVFVKYPHLKEYAVGAIKNELEIYEKKQQAIFDATVGAKYTVFKNDVEIIKNRSYKEMIDFLSQMNENELFDMAIQLTKPIFDEYPIEKLYLAAHGTFYKYESSGETYFLNEFDLNQHLPDEMYDDIKRNYEYLFPLLDEEDFTETPERGGVIFGIRRTENGLEIFDEDYDRE